MGLTSTEKDPLTAEIIGGAIEVHRALGPGLLESVYEHCLALELTARGLSIVRQVEIPITFREHRIEVGYRADMIVNDAVILELKAVEKVSPVHEAQLLTYLRLSKKRTGLLINFHSPFLRDGIIRRVL